MESSHATFKVGDIVESTCPMVGRWVGEVVEVRKRRSGARSGASDDGYAYETSGRYVSGWAVDENGGKVEKQATLRCLYSEHLTHARGTAAHLMAALMWVASESECGSDTMFEANRLYSELFAGASWDEAEAFLAKHGAL